MEALFSKPSEIIAVGESCQHAYARYLGVCGIDVQDIVASLHDRVASIYILQSPLPNASYCRMHTGCSLQDCLRGDVLRVADINNSFVPISRLD